jgi:hypothetical protein
MEEKEGFFAATKFNKIMALFQLVAHVAQKYLT